MSEPDPLVSRLAAARPVPPTSLRARALAAGRSAWIPWWARLRTWAAAAVLLLAVDALAGWPAGPVRRHSPSPSRPPADPLESVADTRLRQREAYVRSWAYRVLPPTPPHSHPTPFTILMQEATP